MNLNPSQKKGYDYIVAKWNEAKLDDPRWLAYMLATAWHETGFTLMPIRERGSGDGPDADKWDDYLQQYDTRTDLGNTPEKDGDGVLFAGRGYVQITGRNNYRRFGIEGDPEKALEPPFAAHIMIEGMTKGIFTGKKLSDYFSKTKDDAVNARRIINSLDKAQEIAGYYQKFLSMLTSGPKAA